ncbi:hypothetical protein C0Z18_31845 [Trinickia dabaoshanensis]|uniref:Uncharacterized protein n=1 Tax=Trinickia dabaoshanensis TaxID=564714 RepID=A0A2N7VB99_9BURK|nr:hypothetical protein C0Z18_31845 [Trinickia dabaoshanensis]
MRVHVTAGIGSAVPTSIHGRVRQWRQHKTKKSERGCRLDTRHVCGRALGRCGQRIARRDERFSRFRNATRCVSA